MIQKVATGFVQVTSYCKVGDDETSYRATVGRGPGSVLGPRSSASPRGHAKHTRLCPNPGVMDSGAWRESQESAFLTIS